MKHFFVRLVIQIPLDLETCIVLSSLFYSVDLNSSQLIHHEEHSREDQEDQPETVSFLRQH